MLQSRPAYRPDVDGLRAVAVMAVVLFHAGMSTLGGGFVGVDIFFVISGFVIAAGLRRELEAGTFSLTAFYERRARRILPALTVVALATWVACLWIAPPSFFDSFAKSLVATALFLSNMFFWTDSSYFNTDLVFRPLLHTWSLGIEEQYYLLAPIFFLLVFRLLRGRWLLAITPVILASFALGVYALQRGHPDHAFYLLPMRGWEFLIGAGLALSPPPAIKSRMVAEIPSIIGLGLIAFAVFGFRQSTPFPGAAALAPCLGAALLIYGGGSLQQPALSRLLAWRPIVFIGRISYSLYLVHWPLFVLASFALARRLTVLEASLALAACFALAAALYVLVEQPARKSKASRLKVFGFAGFSIALTVAAGLAGPSLNRLIFADRTSVGDAPDTAAFEKSVGWGKCLLADGQSADDWHMDGCITSGRAGEDILLFGDSFAAHYQPGLAANAARLEGRVIQYTWAGCPPIMTPAQGTIANPACVTFVHNVTGLIARQKIKRIVIAGSWLEYDADISLRVASTLQALKAPGVEITLIGQSPNFYVQPFVILGDRGHGKDINATLDIGTEAARINAKLRAIADAAGAKFIDPVASLCRGSLCPVRRDGQDLFLDYGHFTEAGSDWAVRTYFPYISR